MRVPVRAVALSVVVLVSRAAGAAEPLRPRLAISFGTEAGHPGESVTVEVSSLDAAGAPVDAPVALDVDAGKVTAPQRTGTGVYRASIAVPSRLPLSRSLLVLARAGALSADASLRLAPGPAASIHLDGPTSCPEDADACRIDVIAADAYGNPAAEVPDASADLGRVSPAGAAEPGHWVIVYHPPRVDRERAERVAVELGSLRAVHTLQLSPSRMRLGFAALLGAVHQGGRTGFAAGGRVLGERLLGSGWLVGAGLDGAWWRTSDSGEAGALHVSTNRSQLALGLFFVAERSLAGRTTATLSAGGGAVRVNSAAHVEGQPGVSDAGWAPTANVAAAIGYRFPFGMPFLEARAAWVGDARLATDPGAEWPLFLQLGYRLDVR